MELQWVTAGPNPFNQRQAYTVLNSYADCDFMLRGIFFKRKFYEG